MFVIWDLGLRRCPFKRAYALIAGSSARGRRVDQEQARQEAMEKATRAVAIATRLYFRRKQDCLPRSLVLCRLLRRRGVPVALCLGVKQFPFRAHAWVDSEGEPVGDSRERIGTYKLIAKLRSSQRR